MTSLARYSRTGMQTARVRAAFLRRARALWQPAARAARRLGGALRSATLAFMQAAARRGALTPVSCGAVPHGGAHTGLRLARCARVRHACCKLNKAPPVR